MQCPSPHLRVWAHCLLLLGALACGGALDASCALQTGVGRQPRPAQLDLREEQASHQRTLVQLDRRQEQRERRQEEDHGALATQGLVSAEAVALARSAADPLPRRLLELDPTAVPSSKFYVYPGLDWMSLKCDGVPIQKVLENNSIANLFPKHSDDYWFLKHALSHPLRTEDPREATLFVVPSLMNVFVQQMSVKFLHHKKQYERCCVGRVCERQLAQAVDDMLANSTWFQRNEGRDHVIVNSHWYSKETHEWKNIWKCNSISFEENSMWGGRCRVASTYVGRPCPREKRKSASFAMVAALRHEKPFKDRKKVCRWVQEAAAESPELFNVSICGPGEQCPALASAEFGFQAKGDTFGSNRVMDTIFSGTVPFFTHPRQIQILPPFVPWQNMSVMTNLQTFPGFKKDLQAAKLHYDAALSAVDRYAPLIDWKRPDGAFERYMYFFEQCVLGS